MERQTLIINVCLAENTSIKDKCTTLDNSHVLNGKGCRLSTLNQIKIILTVAKQGFQTWRSFFSIFSTGDQRAGIALIQCLQALSETTTKRVQYGRNRCAQAAQSRQPTCNKRRYYATHAELPEGTGPISIATHNTSIETYESLKKDRINQSQYNIAKTSSRKSSREFFDDILKYLLI